MGAWSVAGSYGTTEELAEKFEWVTSAAEAATERKAFIAALKSAAPPQIRAFPQAVEAVPFKNHFNFENQFEKLIRSALACSANLLDSGFLGSFLLAR